MITLTPADPRYPRRLRDLRSPPDPLWVDGDPHALAAERVVAVVGTRRMTAYGERVARELAGALAAAGALVVSGLAQGIDATAHAAALERGTTAAVLGEGISAFRHGTRGPRARLARRIAERGALVSEFPADATAQRWTYAKRNATVAALAEAVVVVEAPQGSGALITARLAARLGRGLYAVPGPLGTRAAAGTNALIADGIARAIVDIDAFVRALGLGERRGPAPVEDPVLERLAAGPLAPDVLGADPARLASLLLDGRIVALPDGRIARRT